MTDHSAMAREEQQEMRTKESGKRALVRQSVIITLLLAGKCST